MRGMDKNFTKASWRAVATGLLAPFVAGAGVPIDLPVDVGPTLDLSVSATTTGTAPAPSSRPNVAAALR